MGFTTTIDLAPVAHGLSLPLASVETVVRLLDAGNTVPFVTRYRKDQTGGLDEEQIRHVEARVARLRMLAERKQTILRSIDSQGKLTPDLAKAIHDADSTKRLEDLYLPFKPKKQSLATLARERQLEPLAAEIASASPTALDLDARARDFVNPDKQVHTAADALLGVGHILAEDFSERADLRDRLRKILKKSGKLVSTRIEPEEKNKKSQELRGVSAVQPSAAPDKSQPPSVSSDREAVTDTTAPQTTPLADGAIAPSPSVEESHATGDVGESAEAALPPAVESAAEPTPIATEAPFDPSTTTAEPASPSTTPLAEALSETVQPGDAGAVAAGPAGESVQTALETTLDPSRAAPPGGVAHAATGAPLAASVSRKEAARREREAKKAKQQDRLSHEFRDYFSYQEQLSRIPPHRILAINRGERAKILRVKIESDTAEMTRVAEEMLIAQDHPHAEFLRGCARDALQRLVIPSLEREIRRELTENAETHAVEVFAKNLRNLLLQPPVRGRRVMALDPGFKSGCKVAILDEFGNLLDHVVVHLIGKAERKQEARARLIELIRNHSVKVLAIGNGTACRETEEFVADILSTDLKDEGAAYVIVNEAGASVYSTSPLGREELPQYDATLRGAISIGRRLQDPLSELVKIDPANIGVGLYQHDVKAKHLRTSLDAVVESCVNYVGVDLNTASPALLRYVSGLNQLTARRLYDYRTKNGPFQRRDQLKEVPGFGEATFVQAAGFLKLTGGEQPLDGTWIHPESYEVAHKVLNRIGRSEVDLSNKETAAELGEQVKALDTRTLADELQVGQMTLGDIVSQFARPGRDPREDLPEPIFKRGILKLEDLQPGMELSGSVLNVVDFGAFVDIGLHDSGLVHVSQLANRYVRDPHDVVSVGDIVKVWVLEIDKSRRRVSLTMIPPGTKKPEPHFRRGKPERRPPGQPAAAGEGRPPRPHTEQQGGARPPRPAGTEGRPPRPQPAPGGPPQGRPQQGDRGGRRGAPPAHLRPYGGGRGDGGRSRGGSEGGQGRPFQHRPKPPAKPLPPITKKMIEGKEPMRTFGDLMQFVKVKQSPESGEQQKEKQDVATAADTAGRPTTPAEIDSAQTTAASTSPVSQASPASSTADATRSEPQQSSLVASSTPPGAANGEPASESVAEAQAGQTSTP
ncbi:MAG: Tex-like N-terminal domain-containing protein [Pirellulales bacterium]